MFLSFTKDDQIEGDVLGAELVLHAAPPLAAPLLLGDVAQEDRPGGHDDAAWGREYLTPGVEPSARDEVVRRTIDKCIDAHSSLLPGKKSGLFFMIWSEKEI